MAKSKSRKGRSKSRSKSGSARKTRSKTAKKTSGSSSSRRSRSRSAQRTSSDIEHETPECSSSTPSTAAARRKVVTGPVAPPQTKNNRQQQRQQRQECQATPTGSSDDAEDAVQTTSQQKTDLVTMFRVYTQQRIAEGNRLVALVFPSRVAHINRILASRHFTPEQFARVGDVIAASRPQLATSQPSASTSSRGGEPATKRRRLESRASGRSARGAAGTDEADCEEQPGVDATVAKRPTISDHDDIVTVEALLKPVLYDLLEGAGAVSQWLELSLPTADDADSVRESVLKAVSLNAQIVSKLAELRLRELNNYHLSRGHRIAQMMSCSDETVAAEFERLIAETDCRQLLRARDMFVESRDQYLILCNLVEKNREQIDMPSSRAFSSLVS